MKLVTYEELNVINSKKFEEFYNKLCDQDFTQMDEFKNKAKGFANLKVYSYCFIVVCIIICFIFLFTKNILGILFLLILGVFVSIMLHSIITKNLREIETEYKKKYKEVVISNLLKTFNNDISYTPYVEDEELSTKLTNLYINSGVDKTDENAIPVIDDYIVYDSNDYSMQVFDIDFKPKNEYDINSAYAAKTKYAGLFADISIDLITDFETIIETSNTEDSELTVDFEKIQMDDSTFESLFNVFTKNADMTKRILTHEVMNELRYFCYNTRLKMTIAIRRNKIYFTFYTGNMFEPTIDGDILNKNIISRYYNVLSLIFKLTDYLHELVTNTYKIQE